MPSLDDVSVLVPYRPFHSDRDDAWTRLVEPAWARTNAEVIIHGGTPGNSPAEFNHPLAINQAATRATRRYLLIADADCLWSPLELPARLVAAISTGASWALPVGYTKLTRRQTRLRFHGKAATGEPEWHGDHVSWAGLVAISSEAFWRIGGYDERFAWWGADDMAFGLKADTLLGRHERVAGSVLHLWHPAPLGETYGHERHREQHALSERYKRAAGDADKMLHVAWPDRTRAREHAQRRALIEHPTPRTTDP